MGSDAEKRLKIRESTTERLVIEEKPGLAGLIPIALGIGIFAAAILREGPDQGLFLLAIGVVSFAFIALGVSTFARSIISVDCPSGQLEVRRVLGTAFLTRYPAEEITEVFIAFSPKSQTQTTLRIRLRSGKIRPLLRWGDYLHLEGYCQTINEFLRAASRRRG